MKTNSPRLLFALAAIGLGPTTSQATMILEGGFESYPGAFFALPGSPITSGPWTFSNHAGVDSIGVNPGKHARLESTGLATSDPTVSQTVTGFVIGATYTLEWDWGRRVSLQPGSGRSFGVFLDTQTFASALFLDEYLDEIYRRSSVSFVATATSHTIIFAGELDGRTNGLAGSDTDVSYNLDNVSLTGGPTSTVPDGAATAALLAVGLALLARMRCGGQTSRRSVKGS